MPTRSLHYTPTPLQAGALANGDDVVERGLCLLTQRLCLGHIQALHRLSQTLQHDDHVGSEPKLGIEEKHIGVTCRPMYRQNWGVHICAMQGEIIGVERKRDLPSSHSRSEKKS